VIFKEGPGFNVYTGVYDKSGKGWEAGKSGLVDCVIKKTPLQSTNKKGKLIKVNLPEYEYGFKMQNLCEHKNIENYYGLEKDNEYFYEALSYNEKGRLANLIKYPQPKLEISEV